MQQQFTAMSAPPLHVTNGDYACGRIQRLGLGGTIIAWRDALHEGPVPAGLDPDELRALRARFMSESGWADYHEALRHLSERDHALASAAQGSEVVLWFEHDLYDQLQLLQILDALARLDGARSVLVQADDYLGGADEAALRGWYERREPVSAAQLALARAAWGAFRSPDPTAIEAVLGEDLGVLPFLRPALVRHLEEFPALGTGLSRTERQLLEAVRDGGREPHAVFEASQAGEDARFLGDAIAFDRLTELGGGPEPLVSGPPYALTAVGAAVLDGTADRVELGGLDLWLGGAHLTTGHVWRWDAADRRLRS